MGDTNSQNKENGVFFKYSYKSAKFWNRVGLHIWQETVYIYITYGALKSSG